MVAVRSSGLSLESIIGYCDDDNDNIVYSLVTEEYLEMLIAISNERFAVNADRKDRFWKALQDLSVNRGGQKQKSKKKPPGWEDPGKRRERKMAEGLLRKNHIMEIRANNHEKNTNDVEVDVDV